MKTSDSKPEQLDTECGVYGGAAVALVATRNELCAGDRAKRAGYAMRCGTARITTTKIHIRSRTSKRGQGYAFVERRFAADVFE
jgi:hypothetical protein